MPQIVALGVAHFEAGGTLCIIGPDSTTRMSRTALIDETTATLHNRRCARHIPKMPHIPKKRRSSPKLPDAPPAGFRPRRANDPRQVERRVGPAAQAVATMRPISIQETLRPLAWRASSKPAASTSFGTTNTDEAAVANRLLVPWLC